MKTIVKSLMLAMALMVPTSQKAVFTPQNCDTIVRMTFGVIAATGLYKILEDSAYQALNVDTSAVEVNNRAFLLYSEDVDGSHVLLNPRNTFVRKLIKLAKICGKSALILAIGYALTHNSLTNMFLQGAYHSMEADMRAGLVKSNNWQNDTVLVTSSGDTKTFPFDTNVVVAGDKRLKLNTI